MGTKRSLAPVVRQLVKDLEPTGSTLDLFAGMGSVTHELRRVSPVVVNDALDFVGAFSRARFTSGQRSDVKDVAAELFGIYEPVVRALRSRFAGRIAREDNAIKGTRQDLQEYMAAAPHAGSSARIRKLAKAARGLTEQSHYSMTTLYFSASYFSTRQTVALDALRYAIDTVDSRHQRDWLLSAWLATAGRVINAPGHTAQFLKPNTDQAAKRIRRQWQRPVWSIFREELATVCPVGPSDWRRKNRVTTFDALGLVADGRRLTNVSLAYADPPYTKDHYSRYYHIYETMYRYDFPGSTGAGRYRTDRSPSRFSLATQVVESFSGLLENLNRRGIPLVLSYPSDGLIQRVGADLEELVNEHMTITRHIRIATTHSTLGAQRDGVQKNKEENLYVCVPN
jgi:adenine-specific DNA-methyltransferase